MIKLDISSALPFLAEYPSTDAAETALKKLLSERSAPGHGFLSLPKDYSAAFAAPVKDAARRIRSDSDVLIVIGAGGSYLGARAALELLDCDQRAPEILFAGNSLSAFSLQRILGAIADRDFSLNVVSKSGGTLEPLAAFHILYDLLRKRYGSQADKRVYVTTDPTAGPLRAFARERGMTAFDVPESVGGRYSVLSAVGLLPMAAAGIDINDVMYGAFEESALPGKSALLYAAVRQALYASGKKLEILSSFEPAFEYTARWWVQLFGESEGKNSRGIFPSFCTYTADLHSLGQYIQQGERSMFETVVSFASGGDAVLIPAVEGLSGSVSQLCGRSLSAMNEQALEAVSEAHIAGGVPVIRLSLPDMRPHSFGALVYFFELSCALSATLGGTDPFDQPGVEAYKRNLRAALGIV